MNNAVFWKNYGKCEKKHGDIKHVATERRRNYLILGPKNYTTKYFT